MKDTPIKILLIEDNPGDVRLIGKLLSESRGARFKLEWAASVSSGLERLAAGGVHLILLDLSLPDSDGFETFARVHARASAVPIVVLFSRRKEFADDVSMVGLEITRLVPAAASAWVR